MTLNDGKHSKMSGSENHGIISEPNGSAFANAAARVAYVVTSDDLALGLVVRQVDTGRDYIAIATGAGANSWRLIGSGDITGTLGSTDNVVPRSDGTGTLTLQSSAMVISDAGVLSGVTVADPSTAQQIASKAYADTKIGGSAGATDNRVLRADGTGTLTIQNSAVTIADDGTVTGALVGTPATSTEIANKSYVDNRVIPLARWGMAGSPATTSARFMPNVDSSAPVNGAASMATVGYYVAPVNMTVTSITASYANAVQVTDSLTFTLFVDGVASALTVTITPSVAAATGTHAGIAVNQAQMLSMQVVQSGSAASTTGTQTRVSIAGKSS